jgi:O-antigen/teichoic acid export membrane protein
MFKQIAVISVIILIIQTGLIYVLSGKTGLNLKGLGASIALLITNILLFIIYNEITKKTLCIKRDKKIYFTLTFQIILGFLAMMVLRIDLMFLYFIVPVVFLAIIFFVEWNTRIITKDDLNFFLSLVNIRPLFKYIKDEMNNL